MWENLQLEPKSHWPAKEDSYSLPERPPRAEGQPEGGTPAQGLRSGHPSPEEAAALSLAWPQELPEQPVWSPRPCSQPFPGQRPKSTVASSE